MKLRTLGPQILSAALILSLAGGALADTRIYTIVTDVGMVNHWPGPDALIGTGDDLVSASNSPLNNSLPNANGSYSYNAFYFGGADEPLHLPTGVNAATFIEGQIVGDMVVGGAGGGALVTDWSIAGTEPYAGHGPYSSTILNVDSGTYDVGTKAFTLQIDFEADLNGTIDSSLDFVISGTAWMIDAPDFATSTGVPYIDDVLIPKAQALSATGLLYMHGTGTIPAAEHFSWPAMPMEAVFFGVSVLETPTVPSTWSQVKSIY